MEIMLLILIVLLVGAICALGGFWFYREDQARRPEARTLRIDRPAAAHDQWEAAVRASRDKA